LLVAGNGHRFTVADGIVLVGVGFTCRVIGGGEAVERVVSVADLACDAADGLRDLRAVTHVVQHVVVTGEHHTVFGVRQAGQAPGGVVTVGSDDAVGQRDSAQTAGRVVGVGGRAGGPVSDAGKVVDGIQNAPAGSCRAQSRAVR